MVDTTIPPQPDNTSPITNTNILGAPPPPPRSTGNPQQDLPLLIDWMWRFYSTVVLTDYYLTTNGQFSNTGGFDPSSLPDPSTSTIPQAQETANQAYTLAQTANTEAKNLNNWASGQLTFTGSAVTQTVTFATTAQQPDTNYKVLLTVAAITGTPATDSLFPVFQTNTKTGFTITIAQAPGSTYTVTYNYLIVRNI